MERLVFFIVVSLIIIRVVSRFATQDTAKRQAHRAAVVARFRKAAAQQEARAKVPPAPRFGRPAQFPVHTPAPPMEPPPATPMWLAPPQPPEPRPAVATPSAGESTLSSSTDTTLSTSLGEAQAPSSQPAAAGPQLVPLSPDLERRVMELMDQNYEVLAVRLLCDELDVGILAAQKTVRTLAGLPTTY